MTQVIKFRPSRDYQQGDWLPYGNTNANEAADKERALQTIYDKIAEPQAPDNSQGGYEIINGAESKVNTSLIVELAKDAGDPDIDSNKQYRPKIRLTLKKEKVDSDVETDCKVDITAKLLNACAEVESAKCTVPDDFDEEPLCLKEVSGSELDEKNLRLELHGSIDNSSKRRLKCGWALVELHES